MLDSSWNEFCYAAKNRYGGITAEEILGPERMERADRRFEEWNEEFEIRTKLSKADLAFVTTAVGLQVLRQYFITPYSERCDADTAAKDITDRYKQHGSLGDREYYASLETICNHHSVPFDIIKGSKAFDLGGTSGKARGTRTLPGKGLSGNTHRYRTLGHDPILGYVFGTSNIMTNTITMYDLSSYHIAARPSLRRNGGIDNVIDSVADTGEVFENVWERFLYEKDGEVPTGKVALAAALVKEYLHLRSDNSVAGLPVPFLQLLSPDAAQKLGEIGIDAISIQETARQTLAAKVIDFIISILHVLYLRISLKEYQDVDRLRTRRILMLSNIIASSSNLIAVSVGTGVGLYSDNPEMIRKSLRYADYGGLLNTICYIISSADFELMIRKEFFNNKIAEEYRYIEKEILKLGME